MARTREGYIVFVPIYGLEIGRTLRGELQVETILFVSAAKVPRIRKRLRIPKRMSEYHSRIRKTRLLDTAPTYAVVRTTRNPENKGFKEEGRRVKEALWLLASSLFARTERAHSILSLYPQSPYRLHQHFASINITQDAVAEHLRGFPAPQPCVLDRSWKHYTSMYFFFDLLRILRGMRNVDDKWRDALRNAAILAGQSHLARYVHEAFLYDMIAIESLLTERHERQRETLISHLVALFGWTTQEDPAEWEHTVTRLYERRSQLVHHGRHDQIDPATLLTADTLLANLLINLCQNTATIKRRADIVSLAEELQARRCLGLKPVRRPRRLTYFRPVLSSRTLERTFNEDVFWTW